VPLSAGGGRAERLAYVATTILALMPVWLPPIFPSQDGPSHLYNAHALARLLSGAPQYAAVYDVNLATLANWADHVVLALLTTIASPVVAEKLLLSGYVLAFSAAARYAAASIRAGHGWLAHLALPLMFTFSVHMGFYNFIASFPLYFLLLGFYWRHRDGQRTGTLALLLLLMYVLHPVAWAFGVLSLTVVTVASARDFHRHGHTSPSTTARRLRRVWVAALPGAVLLFVLIGNEPTTAAAWQPLSSLLRHVYLGGPLWTFGPADDLFGAALFVLLVAVTIAAWRGAGQGNAVAALAWAAAAYFALLLVLPSQWKALSLITERIGTFAFLTWVVALAGYDYSLRMRRAIVTGAQVLAIVLIAHWTLAARTLAPYHRDYLAAADQIAPGAQLLELNFAPRGRGPDGQQLSHPLAPFTHTAALVGALRDAVVINDYEALYTVFPLRHRVDPARHLMATLHAPPEFWPEDIENYERATCRAIDYLLVWQPDRTDDYTRAVLRTTADMFTPVYRSPAGYLEVHRRTAGRPCT
jgi:hypothetical protein